MNNRKGDKGILLASGTNEVEFLHIGIGGGDFGINVAKVCQILKFDPSRVAQIPDATEGCVGTMYFRERPILIYDMHLLLKIPRGADNASQLLLVCEFNTKTTGFLIGGVFGIERCSWTEFIPLEDAAFKGQGRNILGSVRIKDKMVLILDLEAAMSRVDPSMDMSNYKIETGSELSAHRADLKIVYCEDSEIITRMLTKTLREAGFQNIRHFYTGKAGLEYLQSAAPGEVDLIISDIEMPEMDGLTLCKSVRGIGTYKDVPFLIFSSTVNDQARTRCASVGVDAAFSKPELRHIVSAIDSRFKGA